MLNPLGLSVREAAERLCVATAARMLDLFSTAIGTPEHLTAHCVARNMAFLRGMGAARAPFERKAA